ncbi:MAG: QueT transporter family protein [Clostridia bacterium]|nr:QueT transporter family protein [Clostridia bacterium]
MKTNVKSITRASLVAGMYIVLTMVSNMMGLASGAIQFRLSEALTLLPVIFPESVWGLFIGCILSNFLTGCVIWDIIFGSIATLIAALLTRKLKNKIFLASLCPVISNAVIVPFVLKYAYCLGDAWWYLCVTVGIGEVAVCCLLAPLVLKGIQKHFNK